MNLVVRSSTHNRVVQVQVDLEPTRKTGPQLAKQVYTDQRYTHPSKRFALLISEHAAICRAPAHKTHSVH